MTPQEEADNAKFCALPAYKELKENDILFHQELTDIRKGQLEIDARLDKGGERMDNMQKTFEDHISTTKDNHKESMNAYTEMKIEIKDNKVKDLAQELNKERERTAVFKGQVWGYVKLFVSTATGILLTALAMHFGIK